MKNTLSFFSILIACSFSFSQEKIEQNGLENETIKKTENSVFKFYPNPVDDELFILGTYKIKSIEIINDFGKVIKHFKPNKRINKLNVLEIKSGVYLIKVVDEKDKMEVKRIIKK